MKNNLNEELKDIKYLFNYDRGRILSEQPEVKEVKLDDYEEEFDLNMDDKWNAPSPDDDYEDDYEDDEFEELRMDDDMPSYKTKWSMPRSSLSDMELDEEMDLPVMLPGTKEKERIKVDPGTKPKKPKTPYKPKPGPKPDPKARKRKGDMPSWLTFDELGIDFE
jgi:hypothetical protein